MDTDTILIQRILVFSEDYMTLASVPPDSVPVCNLIAPPVPSSTLEDCNKDAKLHRDANMFAYNRETCLIYSCSTDDIMINESEGYLVYKMLTNGLYAIL